MHVHVVGGLAATRNLKELDISFVLSSGWRRTKTGDSCRRLVLFLKLCILFLKCDLTFGALFEAHK